MALHRSKRRAPLGLAEFIGLCSLALATAFVTMWWQEDHAPAYWRSDGRVIEGKVVLTHYNSTDLRSKVSITYEYMAEGATYTKSWSGFWPDDNSPNALPENRINELCEKGHPLIVLYDRQNPSEGILHPVGSGGVAIRQAMAVVSCVWALAYCVVLYPTWRLRFAGR
jgi:hypothetical protein